MEVQTMVHQIGVSDRTLRVLALHAIETNDAAFIDEVTFMQNKYNAADPNPEHTQYGTADVRTIGVSDRTLTRLGEHALALQAGHPVRVEVTMLMTRYQRAQLKRDQLKVAA